MTTRRIGLLAALFTIVFALPTAAEELVVATFGGTFVDNSKKCHAAAFEKATGATVKYVLGSSVQTMAKLRAPGARSEPDLAYMDSQIVTPAQAAGPLHPLGRRRWPTERVLDVSRQGRALGVDDVRGQ
jgi:putative spermidine/putrescine transport system substrate-binding protein